MAKKVKEDTSIENAGGISSILKLVKSVDDSAEIIQDSAQSNIQEWIPTGNYILNACMSGDLFKAIPTGRIISFCGPSGCLPADETIEVYIMKTIDNIHHNIWDESLEDVVNPGKKTYSIDITELKEEICYVNDDDPYNLELSKVYERFQKMCERKSKKIKIFELFTLYKNNAVFVNTPDGFQLIGDLVQKKPRVIYTITTKNHSVRCSEDHLIETKTGWAYAKNVQLHDEILTKDGYEDVTELAHDKTEPVYDFEVLHVNHRYYAGTGISSHNTGKSFLACSVCREAQKMGYTPIYMDSEGAIDADFVRRLGVDPNRLIIKPVQTIFETSQFIANLCKALQEQQDKTGTHDKVIFVLDSLGNLTSEKERDDTLSGNQKADFTKAKDVKALFRVNATPLNRLNISLICTNHVYSNMSFIPQNVQASGCCSKATLVKTLEYGDYPIEKIIEGIHVLSNDGEWHKIEKTWIHEKPTYKIEFSDNIKPMTCSDTHRFLVDPNNPELESSWKTIEELNEGDEIYILRNSLEQIKILKKIYNPEKETVYDLTVADTANYVTANGVINHNSGIVYNASITIELSAAKLADTDNDKEAKGKAGEGTVKNGILVTAKPIKSRFCRPIKTQFSIPYFKAPNPYVGLEKFMTWENSGVTRGTVLSEKDYLKLSEAEKAKVYPFEYDGIMLYCQPKDTARGIVVKHLGRQVSFADFWSPLVFTQEFLEYLNENVIKPVFELPDQSSYEDITEIENILEADMNNKE